MLLYILLILGQAFASQKQADQIYDCVNKMARHEAARSTSNSFTVREVTESCRDEIGATQIFVKEAKITESTTHYIKLIWQEKGKEFFRHYAFNIPNSKLCNEVKGSVKGFTLNLRDILNNTKNSKSYNSCEETEADLAQFGFKKNGKSCKRICPKNSVLQGTRASVLFNLKGDISNYAGEYDHHQNLDEIYLETKCVPCPKDHSPKNIRYTTTHEKDNLCYDEDGCPEGFEHIPGVKSFYGFPSDKNPKKFCVMKCHAGFARDSSGECVEDQNQQCQLAKARQERPRKWLAEFLQITESQKVGTCDMGIIRDLALLMTLEAEKTLKLQVDKFCLNKKLTGNDKGDAILSSFKLAEYLNDRYRESHKCIINIKDKDTNFNSELYRLFNEDLLQEDSSSRDYEY